MSMKNWYIFESNWNWIGLLLVIAWIIGGFALAFFAQGNFQLIGGCMIVIFVFSGTAGGN